MRLDADDARNILSALTDAEAIKAGRDFLYTGRTADGAEIAGRVVSVHESNKLVLLISDDGDNRHETIPWDQIDRVSVELADD
jgi:hypothetical protein